jgi:hypothetical protein
MNFFKILKFGKWIVKHNPSSGGGKFPIFVDSFIFRKFSKNAIFLIKSRVVLVFGFTYAPHKFERIFAILFEFYMVSSGMNFFEIYKFRQRRAFGRFCLKFDSSKMSQIQSSTISCILKHNNISVRVYFPIFVDSFIFTKFWKNEFLWKKSRVLLVLAVLRMLLTSTRGYLHNPSSSTRFRVVWIFRNSEISSRRLAF